MHIRASVSFRSPCCEVHGPAKWVRVIEVWIGREQNSNEIRDDALGEKFKSDAHLYFLMRILVEMKILPLQINKTVIRE